MRCTSLPQEALHPAFARLEAHFAQIQAKRRRPSMSLTHSGLTSTIAFWTHSSICVGYYGVSLTPVDYRDPEGARQQINAWVEEKTNGKIQDLIPPGIIIR